MFRLAKELGMTVAELGQRVSSRELVEWSEFYKLEPFGDARHNVHAGMICATIANTTPRKSPRQFKPEDFMLTNTDHAASTDAEPDTDQTAAKEAFGHYATLFGSEVADG